MVRRHPRVSIGIPVFNGERFLGETLESILGQTYDDLEIVISDNASTDGTADICTAAARRDSRVFYHRNPHNLGIAPNCNRAFALATGEFYKLADYDDLLAPEFVSRCVEGLDAHPGAAVCFPRTRLIDDEGRIVGEFEPPASACSPDAHVRFRSLVLEPDHIVSQASGLMRSALVRQTV
ncbi:MAG: glycosyltransferase family 2 protein, partial [Vicinamibacterales bacterium]